tara:strand:- start:2379 stop:3218 length:840 start_codon:yes stop_codon:yes gene_type:complete
MMSNFWNWLENRIDEYEAARLRGIKAYDTRIKRAAAEYNDDLEPIYSEKSGRLHAPCDGYVWTWCEGGNDLEGTYLAGQYLPFPKERESILGGGFTGETEFKTPADRADKFLSQWRNLPASTREIVHIYQSRVFHDKKGIPSCFLTISKCPEDICEAIREKVIGDLVRLQKYAQEQQQSEREKRDAAHEAGEDAPEGRIVITGIVLAFKLQSSQFGDTLKMLVQDDRGFRVWGSVPKSLDDAERESRITFTATVTASDRDAKFGFFKRPTKAEILEEAA